MKLYSYVVEHDNGFAPNPYYRICTLAHCKYGHGNKRNIVELAEIGDWVAGTGGHSGKSAGNGKLVYAMRVDEKLTLKEYYDGPRFKKKKRGVDSYRRWQGDNLSKFKNRTRRFVLISREYYYFGDKARKIPGRFRVHPVHPLEKKGPGFRNRFSGSFVSAFIGWLQQNYRTGMHGRPRGQKREEKEGRPVGVPSKLQQRVCQ